MSYNKGMRKQRPTKWDTLAEQAPALSEETCPVITTIIPTQNSAHSIALTLDSLTRQRYPHFEIIVLDAGSTDRTLEIVKGYFDQGVRLHSVTEYNVYEMYNRGSSLAAGRYLNFLFPGDFYISQDTLSVIGHLALEENSPDLIFGGCLLRDAHINPRVLLRDFSLEILKKGKQPTSLQSCWWRSDTFIILGKFRTNLRLRGGFDLMCRFALKKGLRAVGSKRVLTDYDRRSLTQKLIMIHFWETLPILFRIFGFSVASRWLVFQRDLYRTFRLWLRGLRVAFFGR